MHRLAESLLKINREAYIVQDDAAFHPSWFKSAVQTIDLKSWRELTLNPEVDRVILPETFITVLHRYAKYVPKIIFNQNPLIPLVCLILKTYFSLLCCSDLYRLYHLFFVSQIMIITY